MLIKRIALQNFKRFRQLNIELKNLDCLVGSNNSGKSTLLQALALFDFVLHHCISKKGGNGSNELEIKSRSLAPEELLVLPVATPTDLWNDKNTQKAGKHIPIVIDVEFTAEQRVTARVELHFNRFLVSLETDNNQEWLRQLATFKVAFLPVFSTFLAQEERRTPAVIEDALARGRVNSVIRNMLYNLKVIGKIQQLETLLKRTFVGFQNLSVNFDEITDRYINVSYLEEGKPKAFDLFMAGSGFQQIVYLFGYIFLRNPDVVLLDEPDIHLHGLLQGSLLQELQLLANDGKQVIFATHSRDLITRIDPNHIITLSEQKVERLKARYDVFDALDALGSIDNIQLAQIQNFKKLLIVEDVDDWKYLNIFGFTLYGAEKWQQVVRRLAILPAKGNPYKQDILRLKKQLQHILALEGKPLSVLVICDLDYYPYREELMQEKNGIDSAIEYYIWQRSEIENYLLIPDALFRIAEKTNPINPPSKTDFVSIYNQILSAGKDRSEENLISGIEYYRNTYKTGWDAVAITRKMKEIIAAQWQIHTASLADAKSFVLPELKRWLQNNGFKQFSNKSLAETIQPQEVPDEVKLVIQKIANFSGAYTNS